MSPPPHSGEALWNFPGFLVFIHPAHFSLCTSITWPLIYLLADISHIVVFCSTYLYLYFSLFFLLTMLLISLSQQTLQPHESFGELLRAASTIGDLRNCPVSVLWKVFIQSAWDVLWSITEKSFLLAVVRSCWMVKSWMSTGSVDGIWYTWRFCSPDEMENILLIVPHLY